MTKEELQRRTEAALGRLREEERKRALTGDLKKQQDEIRQQQRLMERCREVVKAVEEGIARAADHGMSFYRNTQFPDYSPVFREAVQKRFPDLTIEFKVVSERHENTYYDGEGPRGDGTYRWENRTTLTISW